MAPIVAVHCIIVAPLTCTSTTLGFKNTDSITIISIEIFKPDVNIGKFTPGNKLSFLTPVSAEAVKNDKELARGYLAAA